MPGRRSGKRHGSFEQFSRVAGNRRHGPKHTTDLGRDAGVQGLRPLLELNLGVRGAERRQRQRDEGEPHGSTLRSAAPESTGPSCCSGDRPEIWLCNQGDSTAALARPLDRTVLRQRYPDPPRKQEGGLELERAPR